MNHRWRWRIKMSELTDMCGKAHAICHCLYKMGKGTFQNGKVWFNNIWIKQRTQNDALKDSYHLKSYSQLVLPNHLLTFCCDAVVAKYLFFTVSAACNTEGNGTPLQYSCLENPMDGGAWWAAVHGVARSRTRLRDFTFTFHFHALEKEMATHSSVLAWRIPGTAEPGGLPSMGSHRVGHDWSVLAAAATGN